VGEENREIAAKGFWFQRSDEEKRQSRYQWGPPNPQALNRYAYCLGNPLRYIDPTGHDQVVTVELTLEELEALIGLIEDLMWYNTGGGVLFTGGGSLLVLASGPVGIPVIVVGIILGVDAVQLGMFAGYLKDALEAARAQGMNTVTISVWWDPEYSWWSGLGVSIGINTMDTEWWLTSGAVIWALAAIFNPEELRSTLGSWFE